jgi:hypothetical protein
MKGVGDMVRKNEVVVAEDSSFAFIYSPRGEPFTLDKCYLKGKKMNEIWFDP